MRVGQKADVEHQIRVFHGTVFEAKALKRHGEAARRPGRQQLIGQLAAKHRGCQPGGVDHDVGQLAQGSERVLLARDSLGHASGRCQGVSPAGLLVPREQRLFVGFEEQHPMADPTRPQVLEHGRHASAWHTARTARPPFAQALPGPSVA